MRRRASLLLLCSSTLLVSARPAPPPPSVAGNDSAVRCRLPAAAPPSSSVSVQQQLNRLPNFTPSPATPPPPGPPPPPPPPPPPAAQMAQGVVVTGSRTNPNGYSAASPMVRAGAPAYGTPGNTERYAGEEVAAIQSVAQAPVSTFSIDVDTGSYANVRRFLTHGQAVPAAAVRTEEMINYFRYDYPRPQDRDVPFSITTDVAQTPWNAGTRLLRIGLRGYDVASETRPPANLVFLVDVSGSMMSEDKLPLVKSALAGLSDGLRADDRVSIVVYAGAAGMVLAPTSSKADIKIALGCLQAGGSTAGADGIRLAYDIARANFRQGGVNRIFLATDGDFNVGISDNKELEALVKKNRDDGITLTTLGFGSGNYNEAMMERIADVGNGNYAYIDSIFEAQKVLEDELAATLVTIAKDVKVQVEFNPASVREYRLIGYENRRLAEEDFKNDAVDAGDMGAGHQVTALYEVVPAGSQGWLSDRRYEGNRPSAAPSGPAGEAAYVKLRFKLPDGKTSREISRAVPASAFSAAAAPRGDMAFVTAVAAYGQKLRGDKYLGDYGWNDIAGLARPASGYTREEFLKLLSLAGRES